MTRFQMDGSKREIEQPKFLIRYGRGGTAFTTTERKARNCIRRLLADQSWRRGFQGNTDIGLFTLDEHGSPTLIEAVDVPDDTRRLGEPTWRKYAGQLAEKKL